MRALVVLSLLAAMAAVHAEEAFDFSRYLCNPKKNEIKFEPVRFWDIGDKVWGDRSSAQHIALLKGLERDHGLYVFDEDYGYYDGQKEIVLRCGSLVTHVKFEYFKKKFKSGETRELRIYPVAWIFSANGQLLARQNLWISTEPTSYAYGFSMTSKALETNVYRVKLAVEPGEPPCCFSPSVKSKN